MTHVVTLASAVQGSTTDIDVKYSFVDADSRTYIIAQLDAVTGVPTAAQIIAGLNGDAGAAAASVDSGGLQGVGGAFSLPLIGLTAEAQYDIYAVSTDADGANEGAVDGILAVVMAAEYLPPATGSVVDFPTNPNAAVPDGPGARVDDTENFSLNPFANPAFFTLDALTFLPAVPSITLGETVTGETHNFYAAAYPIGVIPTAAALKAGTGAIASGSDLGVLTTVAASVVLTTGLVTTDGYWVFTLTNTAVAGDSDVFFMGEVSMLDDADKPYVPVATGDWVTAYAPITVLNAGAYSSPNKTFPVEFFTVISYGITPP